LTFGPLSCPCNMLLRSGRNRAKIGYSVRAAARLLSPSSADGQITEDPVSKGVNPCVRSVGPPHVWLAAADQGSVVVPPKGATPTVRLSHQLGLRLVDPSYLTPSPTSSSATEIYRKEIESSTALPLSPSAQNGSRFRPQPITTGSDHLGSCARPSTRWTPHLDSAPAARAACGHAASSHTGPGC
jgi:hypothetical protein